MREMKVGIAAAMGRIRIVVVSRVRGDREGRLIAVSC